MKRPILKTKRFTRTSKRAAPAKPPSTDNPTKAAWLKAEFSPMVQAQWDAIGKAMLRWKASDIHKRLRVDPTGRNDEFLASMLGWVHYGMLKTIDRAAYGEHLLTMLEELEPDELETAFAAIVRMRRRMKAGIGELHKNTKWAALRGAFVKEMGREIECKGEFAAFVEGKGCPMPASDSGKTRIWKLLGMRDLPQKTRRK